MNNTQVVHLRLRHMQLIRDMPSGSFTVYVTIDDVHAADVAGLVTCIEQASTFQFMIQGYHLAPIYTALAAYGGLKLLCVSGADCVVTRSRTAESEASPANSMDISVPLVFQNGIKQLVPEQYKNHVNVVKVVHRDPKGYKTHMVINPGLNASLVPLNTTKTDLS